MPVYLRIFYFRQLDKAKRAEQKEYDKAKKGGGHSSGPPQIPSFAKPSIPSTPSVPRK